MLRALTVGTAALAGCNFGDPTETESTPSSSPSPTPTPTPEPLGAAEWPTHGYDAANTGGPSDNHGQTTEPTLAWTYEGTKPTWAPVVVGGTAYVSSGSEMLALDATSGDQQWVHSATERFSGDPVVGDDLVVVGNGTTTSTRSGAATVEWPGSTTPRTTSSQAR